MYVRRFLALGAVLLGVACEIPVDTGASNPDFGVTSVAIQPKTAAVLVGDSLQLSASVVMSNQRPPNSVTWASANTSLATVSGAGVVRGRAAGSVFIRASSGSKQDSSAVTVMAPSPLPVASVTLAPSSVTVTVGGTVSLVATLKDANGNTLAGRVITWASSNTGVATVTGTGVVTAAAVGSATITATSEGQSASASVSVATVPVASVSVGPTTASVQAGQTVQLTATPKDASGNALSGRTVTWTSSNVGVATVSGAGLVSGVAAGTVTITATSEGRSGAATVSVTSVPVAAVSVSPATASVQAGQTVQLTATPKDANGTALSGRTVTWASSNAGVATVSGTGLVTGVAAGSVTITATSEGRSGSATLGVTAALSAPGTVGDLAVASTTDSSVTLRFTEVDGGNGAPASYDIRYVAGTTLSWGAGATGVTKGTCATPVAGTAIGATRTCTVSGLAGSTTYSFELVAFRGTLNVNAVFGGLSNIATGTTAASTAAVASVTLSPSPATVQISGTLQVTATLKDANGNILSGRTVTWVSDNSAIATVSATGLVTGIVAGSATIRATSEGQSGTTPLTVATSQPGQVTYYRTNFSDGTLGPLGFYSYNGTGSWAASTAYVDPGSAHSIKFTIPGTKSDDAAALQAWFGHGGLAGSPLDPTLDQDLFQEVRFVVAPGASAAIGGNTCAGNPTSQIKLHKSVYGQVGGNINGWVMSDFAPCGGVGAMATEPELYGQPTAYSDMRPWPAPLPFGEGQVYDVIYRYHRYTALGVGTVAVWVNGVKVMDSVQRSYIGTTGGSTAGLVLWDGATYLQSPFGAYSVYVLFTQATNYPIGAATASP
jgi:uncharacterized protein YjdB